jgi:hypothetical protein
VVQFLKLFEDPAYTVDLGETKADRRARALASTLRQKTKNIHVHRGIDVLLAQPQGALRRLANITKFKEAVENLPEAI